MDVVQEHAANKDSPDVQPRNRRPDLILARSNPYPTFDNLSWKVISTYTQGQGQMMDGVQNYICAWNPIRSSVGIAIHPEPGIGVHQGTGYSMELSSMQNQILSLNTLSNDEAYHLQSGRSVLLHLDSTSSGDPNHPWIQIRHEPLSGQLEFTYFGAKMEISGEPQGHWDMDEATTGRGLILANSNTTLYTLGLNSTAQAQPRYILSTIPLDTSTIPPTKPLTIRTVGANIDPDCDLSDPRTTMQANQQIIYILCYVSSPNGPRPSRMFKMYKFDGTTTEYLGPLRTENGPNDRESLYLWTPVPSKDGSATWAYTFGSYEKAYEISFIGNNSDYLKYPKTLTTDLNYAPKSDFKERGMDGGRIQIILPLTIIVTIAIVGLVCRFVQSANRRRNTNNPHAANIGMSLSRASSGLHRELHGDVDLPTYTPRPVERDDTAHTLSDPPTYSPSIPTTCTVDIHNTQVVEAST